MDGRGREGSESLRCRVVGFKVYGKRSTFKVLESLRGTASFEQHAMSQATALQTLAREVCEDDAGEVARLVCDIGFPCNLEQLII